MEGRRKERRNASPNHVAPLDAQLQANLHQCYEETKDAETRIRYQMIVLAHQGHRVPKTSALCAAE
jgi:hypothetical protein